MDSPKSDGGVAAGTILTPRSKIRAMMAQVDDDSDNDRANASSRRFMSARTLSGLSNDDETSAEESEASDVPIPKGRLAGRLEVSTADPTSRQSQNSDSEAGTENAYERLRREMQTQQQQYDLKSQTQSGIQALDPKTSRAVTKRRLFTKGDFEPLKPSEIATQPMDDSERPSTKPSENSDLYDASDRNPLLPRPNIENVNNSESDTTPKSGGNERFLALVAKKRAERKALEEAQAQARREREKRLEQSSDRLDEILAEDDGADAEDPAFGRILSSQIRPSRRAGKKAREEISRETQRMSRNMQLTHDAKTRKRYSMQDLLKKMGWKQGGTAESVPKSQNASSSPPASSRPSSDIEQEHATPPTSPATPEKHGKNGVEASEARSQVDQLPVFLADDTHLDSERVDEELPTVDQFLAIPSGMKEHKEHVPDVSDATEKTTTNPGGRQAGKRTTGAANHFHVKTTGIPKSRNSFTGSTSDSDSELDITPANPLVVKLDRVFASLPSKKSESHGKLKLKALAHLTSPTRHGKRFARESVPAGQMYADLQRKARQQAALEKQERIEELKAKGVMIQTAEEREKEQALTEDLLEKARREVEELTKREKEERRKESTENANGGPGMEIDESEDESYRASDDNSDADDENDEEDAGERDVALSGSEDEGDDYENEDEEAKTTKHLFDEEASDDEGEAGREDGPALTHSEREGDDNEDEPNIIAKSRPGRRQRQVITDEDDIDDERGTEGMPLVQSGLQGLDSPLVVNPFARANSANGFDAAPMGLSQAFAATMEDSQLYGDNDSTQMSSAVPAPMPEPDLPVVDQQRVALQETNSHLTSINLSPTSLPSTQYNTQNTQLHLTQFSEMPDPTQDGGIISNSPLAKRFASVPPSTVDTVLIVEQHHQNDSQNVPRKKGRLVRRQGDAHGGLETAPDASIADTAEKVELQDAFATLAKAERRRMRTETFNKKRSNAKEMVQEQAEESEDEYAGLGGASDEESGGEMDEETRKMLDDGKIELNESQLAAFHAGKERAADEKAIEKLYKDINSGMLRRKRGAGGDFDDLSDSDEELERRRRLKRAEFAKMRKALLEDENVGKIAENPKKAAFLKAIEDREYDDDAAGYLDEPIISDLVREDSLQEVPDSQPETPTSNEKDVINITGEKRKRPLEEMDPNTRLPATARRTKANMGRKPISMADIRESVSFLVEEPHMQGVVQVAATQSSDAEDNVEGSIFAERRRSNPVVDRLTLKRVESAEAAAAAGGRGRLAFFARGQSDQANRVPALLRKATTQGSSGGGEVSYSTERMAGNKGRGDGEHVRRGGGKKSNLAYFARDAERRKALAKVEMRRNNERKKATEGRRGVLKGLGGGTFD